VRKAFKKVALLLHPDKYKSQDVEQQAAVAEKFKQVGGWLGGRVG